MELPTLDILLLSSAGIGRTGTFMALDFSLDQLKNEGIVDLLKYTTLMRTNRVDMIQTLVSVRNNLNNSTDV